MSKSLLAATAVIGLSVAGCFSPDLPAMVACGPVGECPPANRCDPALAFCVPEATPLVASLRFSVQPVTGEAVVEAPGVAVELLDDTGAVVPFTGGAFTLHLDDNPYEATLTSPPTRPAERGVIRFEPLAFSRPAQHLTLTVHAGPYAAKSDAFDVTFTRPQVSGLAAPGASFEGCAAVPYALAQAQGQPVDLLVEVDPDGSAGPLPFQRATQAGSAPGSAGVQGVRGAAVAKPEQFAWNTTADIGRGDANVTLRVTPRLRGVAAAPVVAEVAVKNGLRFAEASRAELPGLRALLVADVDKDGWLDTVTATGDGVHVALGNGAGDLDLATTAAVTDVAVGDFNGDGLRDLAAALPAKTVVALQQRTPPRSFAPAADAAPVAYRQLLAADFDLDGVDDLLGVDVATGAIVVHRGTRAAGVAFAATTLRPWTLGSTGHVRLADLDRDGYVDLVVGRTSATRPIGIVRNTRAGFAPADDGQSLLGDVLAVGDLDSDGHDDVASLDATGLHMVSSAVGREDLPGVTGQTLAIGDVDGDGGADLVIASATSVSVRLRELHFAFDFGPPRQAGDVAGATSLQVADVDRDGRADLLATSSAALTTLAGATPRPCEPGLTGPIGSAVGSLGYGGLGAWDGALADLNGDGKLDYLDVAGSRISVSDGLGNGRFAAARPIVSVTTPEKFVEQGAEVADLDGDGLLDLVYVVADANEAIVLYADPAHPGSFQRATVPSAVATKGVQAGDLDRDGAVDLVVLGPGQVQLHRGDPAGARRFEPTETLVDLPSQGTNGPACASGCTLWLADLDGDGRLDVLVATADRVHAYLADPAASHGFDAPLSLPLPVVAHAHATGRLLDAAHDALLVSLDDAVVQPANIVLAVVGLDATATHLALLWQAPIASVAAATAADLDDDGVAEVVVDGLAFAAASVAAGTSLPAPGMHLPAPKSLGLQIGDVDADGRVELVVPEIVPALTVHDFDPAIDAAAPGTLLSSIGKGSGFAPGPSRAAVAVDDFTGDGRLDLAGVNLTGDAVRLAAQALPGGTPEDGERTLPGSSFAALGDLDGDRRADLVSQGTEGSLAWLDVSGSDGEPVARCTALAPILPIAIADVDGDARADLVVSRVTEIDLVRSPADTCSAPARVMAIERPGVALVKVVAVAAGDMNRDGLVDVIAVADSVRVALQQPDGSFQVGDFGFHNSFGAQWYQNASVVDLDRDGLLDVLLVESGGVYLLRGDPASPGSLLPEVKLIDLEVPSGWRVEVVDFDGDGRLDLVGVGRSRAAIFLQQQEPPGSFAYAFSTQASDLAGSGGDVAHGGTTRLVDFDRDGKLDLVFADSKRGTVLLPGK
jgi:hypothetical protein